MAPVTIMGAARAITMAADTLTRTTVTIRAGRTRIGATERRGIIRTRITAVIRTVVTTTTTRTTAVIRTVVTATATRTTRQAIAIIADQRLQLSSSALADSATTMAQSTELSDLRLATPSRLFKAEMAWRWTERLTDRCSTVWG